MHHEKVKHSYLFNVLQLLVEDGAIMEECQGWERPAWFSPTNKVEILSYDYGGHYGTAKNQNDYYRTILEKEYSFNFSSYNEIVSY